MVYQKISMKELNRWVRKGNARLFSFPGATSKLLFHYLDVNKDHINDRVILHIGINDILNDTSILNIER